MGTAREGGTGVRRVTRAGAGSADGDEAGGLDDTPGDGAMSIGGGASGVVTTALAEIIA